MVAVMGMSMGIFVVMVALVIAMMPIFVLFILFILAILFIVAVCAFEVLVQVVQALFELTDPAFDVSFDFFDNFSEFIGMFFDETFGVSNVVFNGLFDFSKAQFELTLHVVHVAVSIFNRALNLIRGT
jgi:hypothetical protein